MSIIDADWYWGDISRAQANDLLHGAEDGTFLVRNSTNKSDYTLTVKKDGINKMMRIMCKNGKFGFREPLLFDSVEELIEYYRNNLLIEYNQEMNIKLKYTISINDLFPNITDCSLLKNEGLMHMLITANHDFFLITHQYDILFEDYNKNLNDFQMYKQASESFNEIIAILEEQIRLNETLQKEAMVHETAQMLKHHEALNLKLKQVSDDRTKLDNDLKKIVINSRTIDREINEVKPKVHEKKRHREQICALLIKNGVTQQEIDKKLEELNYENTGSSFFNPAGILDGENSVYPPLNYSKLDTQYLCSSNNEEKVANTKVNQLETHENSSYLTLKSGKKYNWANKSLNEMEWYVGNLTKENVNDLLNGLPNGTFLIRDSKNKADSPYTLTLKMDGVNKMMRILCNNNKYGFKEPLEFESVVELIEYYISEPLVVYKSDLIINLVHPYSKSLEQKYKGGC